MVVLAFVDLKEVSRTYNSARGQVNALYPLDLELEEGEFVMFVGPSGSGKTTLLNLLSGIDTPSSGSLVVDGVQLAGLDDESRREYRRLKVGLIFQFFNLMPNLTALENVELVAELVGKSGQSLSWLERVGLADRADHFPHELSGGEQQRVAIARTMVKAPSILLGDEPTGNLDIETSRTVLKLFHDAHRAGNLVGIVTHNEALIPAATRVIRLANGRVRSDVRNPNPVSVDELDW